MSGISYDLTRIRGFVFDIDGVLSPSVVQLSEEGKPLRMMNVKDHYAMTLAIRKGLKFALISGGNSPRMQKLMNRMGIEDVYLKTPDKLSKLKEWLNANGLDKEEIVYMGDDIPDLKCLRYAGLSCAPNDAAWEVRQTAIYVSRFDGGYGCVRDVVEQVLRAQDFWLADEDAYKW